MDKNPNRPNKGRKMYNFNQINNMGFPHAKKISPISPMINYENINPYSIPKEEYINQPFPMSNMYPMPMLPHQTKEQNIKNMFKMYQFGTKKNFYPYNPNENLNIKENEMSLEDTAQIGNKKFSNKFSNKYRIQRKRKNNYKSNKDKDLINNNNYNEAGQGNNRAISSENNFIYDEDIPDAYYNDFYNNNISGNKNGRKKATTVEYNSRKIRNRKDFKKKQKQKYIDEINNSDNFSNSETKNNNIRPFNNKSNNASDIENNSNFDNNEDNNYYSNEEEYEEDDKNSQEIVVLDDDKSITPKEVIDIKNIRLIEKKENTENNKNISFPGEKNEKNKIIPKLDQMCSEKEIIEREKEKDLDRLEVDADSFPFNRPDKKRMIQKYKRKRGKILNLDDPKEIRTIPAINKSINYLIEEVLDCDKTGKIKLPPGFEIIPRDIIEFISDRFIAIYKTIEILFTNDNNIFNDCTLIENISKMIRTIIIFFNLCLDYYDDQSPKEINSLLDNLLLPLLEYIKDIILSDSKYEYNFSTKDKDEFISYYLFLKLKKEKKNFEKYFQEINDVLNIDESYKEINLVNDVSNSLKNREFADFITILKDNNICNYLTSCFMSLFFKEICVYGLIKLSLKNREVNYRQLYENLIFEDNDEIRDFLIWYGITKEKSRHIVNDTDKVNIFINNKNKNFDYDSAPQKTNKRIIERKRNDKLRKDIVSEKIEFIKNHNYIKFKSDKKQDNNGNKFIKNDEEIIILKNPSLIDSDISKDKSNQNNEINTDINNKEINNNINISNSNPQKEIIKKNLQESFISNRSFKKLFPSNDINKNLKLSLLKENSNNSEKKITTPTNDDFLKPLTPKNISFDLEKQNSNLDNNKSLDLFSHPSISSIEGTSKFYPNNFNEQTIEFFCEVASSIINKIISDRKLNFMYRLKFIVEKYKIKLELIENYINDRKFFVFHELKKCCLNKKFSKEYYKELVNYNNNINSENTNENMAFKINNENINNNKKFELLSFEDIIYFLIKDFEIGNGQKKEKAKLEKENEKNEEENEILINHLQINIYTTSDLIRSTKIISSLKVNKKLIKENSDGSEITIIDNNIIINVNNKLSLIIKFILVDQIIDLDSYIYDNQKNISKYSILIPFFDIIKSDLENQQILTKFFTILDLGLGSFIKKDIIFFFIKRDIDQNSDLYKDYQNMQNDFIFNLMQKYSTNSNKNDIIYIDDDYENNDKVKEKILYLSPIDEFGKCYQEYIKYLNNKTFAELFENNKYFHLNVFNPCKKLISFDVHIQDLDLLINYYINKIENDLQNYLNEINCISYFYNNKLCIEILIGFIMVKILLVYYQYICLSFANELFKIPFYNSNNMLFILEDNLLNTGSIFKQINLEGYDKLWKECFSLDIKKKKNLFSYFDIFSEIICSYNLISDIDIQNYEYCFRKQYYDINLEKKNYEIAKNFVDFFNKIIIKFVSNNNLNIRNNNTSEIFEKIYVKNKLSLISNISKIITSNSICFNEGLIYLNGIGDLYYGLERAELLNYNKNLNNLNLSKKRRRNPLKIEINNKISNDINEPKKRNNIKINRKINFIEDDNNENYKIINNNNIEINESNDKSKFNSKSNISSILDNSGDINDEYYKCFRTVKKYIMPNNP